MKTIPRFITLSAALATFTTPAFAMVSIDWVPVGNAGNAADITGYGAVSYAYNIGKYEVTNAQYADFLNAKGASNSAGIYNAKMAGYGITQSGSSGSFSYSVTSSLANNPVVYVSWFDAARFTNWLGNGQGGGDTETGAYTLISGQTSGIVTVNSGASVYVPSEDEWYKAAYYRWDTSTYLGYPNQSNSATSSDANYENSVGASTPVGTYAGYASPYGTFDQGGNVWEWNDAVISGSTRGVRGGAWDTYDEFAGYPALHSGRRRNANPTGEYANVGFRVASVPEPTSGVLAIFAGGMMLARRKRSC